MIKVCKGDVAMRKEKYKKCLIGSILLALVIIIVSSILYINNDLPDTIFVNSNDSTRYDFSMPVSLEVDNKNKCFFFTSVSLF